MARQCTIDLNQIWVNCSCCHKSFNEGKCLFWLTSCAHIICEAHYRTGMTCCPYCGKENISLLSLNGDWSKLPAEVQSFFVPFAAQLEPLYTVAQFQWDSMVNLCEYYRNMSAKLQDRCSRQKQLLIQAKEELDKYSALKKDLRMQQNPELVGLRTAQIVPDDEQLSHQSFVNKLQNSHRLNAQPRATSAGSSSILAESTTINKAPLTYTPQKPLTMLTSKSTLTSNNSVQRIPGSREGSKQSTDKALPSVLERLKLKRSNTSTVSSRGILSHMRINSSQTSPNSIPPNGTSSNKDFPINASRSKFRRFR